MSQQAFRRRSVAALSNLTLPVICAPMFLVSGQNMVRAACKAGIVGTFPALNARTSEILDGWLTELSADVESGANLPVYGVNLIVHDSNKRLDADLDLCIKHRVPMIITSMGVRQNLIDRVQAYGGMVFHDATTVRHSLKGADAGVDGLILICAGGGGHAGTLSPFAYVPEVRRAYDGTIVLGGAMSSGAAIAAVKALDADFAYLGTRLIATRESDAPDLYKQMILDGNASDVVYTPAITGVSGSFLKASLREAGLSPENLPDKPEKFRARHQDETAKQEGATAWKKIWSAGQGIGAIDDIPSVSDLVTRLSGEFAAAGKGGQIVERLTKGAA